MPVITHAFPILEYDPTARGIIMPNRHGGDTLPAVCVMTFFGDVLADFVSQTGAQIAHCYRSEMGHFPVYSFVRNGVSFCAVQGVVGSASIAMMTDFLIGCGVRKIVACGGCGALDDIPAGDVIIPICALRDEGASYHYLPPARDIELDREMISALRDTLAEHHVPWLECKTWTTDGFYRETPDMVTHRKAEGCHIVEMECATIAAVARFRGAAFGQLLYSGDLLADLSCYDERDWTGNRTVRDALFSLALAAAARL